MNSSHAHMILPTNATSAANSLASMTPTAVALDTVIQTNREGEPPEYREIKTTETILHPTLLEIDSSPDTTTTTKTVTTVEEIPNFYVPGTKTTTTVVEEVPVPGDYVITSAGSFKPVSVIWDSTSANNATTKVVETTVTKPVTKKVIKTTETIERTK
jgi:hypothetical protein